MSGSTCLACMAVCKTCLTGSTCATCTSPATLVAGVCTCPSPTFFNIATKTCLSCTTIQPNCATCDYSLPYDPVSPAPVVCILANPGYYLSSGSAVACVSYCTNCDFTPAPVCSACNTNFVYDGSGSCVCSPTLYFSVTQQDCLACGSVITGCISCQTNTIPTPTQCLTCNPTGYFLANSSCTACPSLCVSCTGTTACTGCINNLTVLSTGMCGCDANASLFLSPTTQSCVICSSVIFECQTCAVVGSSVTCALCSAGFYQSNNSTSCSPCPATCSACSSQTVCTGC
jgi:proprotein convertase subtilisin/kexin type 5